VDFDTLAERTASWTARGREPQIDAEARVEGAHTRRSFADAAAELVREHPAGPLADAMARAAGFDGQSNGVRS
jgi:hypothetical protein